MQKQFRVDRIGTKWVYGYIFKKGGIFHIPAMASKDAFSTDKKLSRGDKFVVRPDCTLGRKVQ